MNHLTTEALRAHFETEREARMWGQSYRITPAVLDAVFGDGQQLIALAPTSHRPNFYVVRINSGWDLNALGENTLRGNLDAIYDAIFEQFGYDVDDLDDEGNPEPRAGWPAACQDDGCEWRPLDWPSTLTPNTHGSPRRLTAPRAP
jgi:hypothetical protein